MRYVWVVLAAIVVVSCTTSPLGRRQLKLLPDSQMAAMGVASFDKMKTEIPQSRDPSTNGYVRCIANAIIAELPPTAARTSWEVVVFEEPSANAFAVPGGRIGVHTGILEVARNQDQLAAVLGHEVAHVIAGHANERVSQAYAAQTALQIASATAGSSAAQRNLWGLLGAGAYYGIILPYSRTHEREADLIGLDLMAKAGFDPAESIQLWKNMAAAAGARPPEFLSTHPSAASRIRDLQNRLPSAKQLEAAARRAGKRPVCD
jgi:predicted Zn-dependent protease